MSFVSAAPERLTYFDLQLGQPNWQTAKVLDFGGNKGAVLSKGMIQQGNYWCVDLSRDAIAQGKREYPRAHWIFYDRYNFAFNPNGILDLPVPLVDRDFDFVLAYSVFTHTSRREMLELVDFLRGLLAGHGKLAFTFIDPHYRLPRDYSPFLQASDQLTNLYLRLAKMKQQNPAVHVEEILRKATATHWCTLVNGCDLCVDHESIKEYGVEEQVSYDTFYTAESMNRIYPDAVIVPPPDSYDPGGSEMQHCCILSPRETNED